MRLVIFSFLRTVKRIVGKLESFALFLFVAKKYFHFRSRDKEKRFSMSLSDLFVCLFDNTPETRFDTHYVYHTAWAARKVKEIGAEEHVDISSSLYFSSIVSAFVPVRFFDYRPAKLNLSNLDSERGDLHKLPFASGSIKSLSCMHTVEHVGLGRYGDPIDPEGDTKATKELERSVAQGGSLLFVVPIGKPKIMWNAHRIYSYDLVLSMFPNMKLREFSLIPDDALKTGMIYNATKAQSDAQAYGCGCFWFIKE